MIDDQLAFGLARLAALARRTTWLAGEQVGLTPTQGEVLDLLARHPAGLRLSTVATQLCVSQPTASEAVAALRRKGLVRSAPDPRDRRAILLRLTREGEQQTDQWPNAFAPIVASLSTEDRELLLGLVQRSIGSLIGRGLLPAQRMCPSCRYFRPAAPGTGGPHHCAYVDLPLTDAELRLDCADHHPMQVA